MAVNPLTPGVYIDEVSVFPPSVAPVATAVPAFIGYTEKGPVMTPTRITSMLDYEQIFGGAFQELITATISATSTVSLAPTPTTSLSQFTMHYNLRMYFANGGGPCYIVSVDDYYLSLTPTLTPNTISSTKLIDGINITEKADEVTLLVVPEAVSSDVTPSQRAAIHSAQLDLCNKMKDRFALMDVITTVPAGVGSITSDSNAFRNNEVGNNNLKYGASYYPSLDTILTRNYLDSGVTIDDDRGGPNSGPYHGKSLAAVMSGIKATGKIVVANTISASTGGETVKIGAVTFTAVVGVPVAPTATTGEFRLMPVGAVTAAGTAASLRDAINSHPVTSLLVNAAISTPTNEIVITALSSGAAGNSIAFTDTDLDSDITITYTSPATATLGGGVDADISLYNTITALISSTYPMRLYPSSTMAGIYASVDRDRGVWKAPANVSLTGVIAPSVNISASEQEGLNVDAGSGKSINAIRAFAGKGILVWGGRTLAGNDNEWRYINVRRLFIFAEESIAKASEFVVFEPNDANTWSRVRSLISNFLTNLWRDGALAGATPAQAFFVRVGLGETMTAQDILEGKLIIEVGLAAVRPAEFIILKFSHKLQEA